MKVLDDPDRLLRDAQAGHPDYEAIYRVVRRPMYLAVWRCLRPYRSYGGFCDDDVVAKAFQELVGGIEGVRSLVGKARVIAYRRAVDLVRKRNLEEPRDCMEGVEDDEELAAHLERMEELFDRATALLERLPVRQRFAVVETVMNRRSCTEVAGELDVSHQAVSKLRKKGLDHLLVWLAAEESMDGEPAGEEGTG
jgi:DNA-directed RNA polymerase specialized sigma24 family protein